MRVAHFWALHAQQALPILGVRVTGLRLPRARAPVLVGAAGYVALIVFTFVQALRGQSLLAFIG